MASIKLAANLHSVRDYCDTKENVYRALKKIREIGFDGVEIAGLYKIVDAESLSNMLKEIGLEVCTVHSYFYRTVTSPQDMIKEAKVLGCNILSIDTITSDFYGVGPEAIAQKSRGGEAVEGGPGGYYRYTQFVKPIVEKFYKEGLKFAYNVQMHEFIKYEGVHGFDVIFNNTCPKSFNFILDTYWLKHAGVNPVDYIRKVAGRMNVCRFRDMKIRPGVEDFFTPLRHECEVGEGTYPFASIIEAVKETGVEWISVRQDFFTRDPFLSLRISYENLKSML